MKKIDFKTSNYNHKEELETFVTAVNDLIEGYNKTFENADAELTKIENNINKKNESLSKLESTAAELTKKMEELEELKTFSNNEIKELNDKKKTISFVDSEVQKMEIDDIDTLIASKKSKISKIETKINSTRDKIKSNNDSQNTAEKALKDLDKSKTACEESLYRTKNLLKLINSTGDVLNQSIQEILDGDYVQIKKPEPTPEVVEEVTEEVVEEPAVEMTDDFSVVDYDIEDMDTPEIDIEEPTIEGMEVPSVEPVIEPVVQGVPEVEEISLEDVVISEPEEKMDEPDYEEEISLTDADLNLPLDEEDSLLEPEEEKVGDTVEEHIEAEEPAEEATDYNKLLTDIFDKETISFSDFTPEARGKLLDNAERVIKNVVVLKKHQIPLELTLEQYEIYYNIAPQDLEDLLNIITTDEDGNGMGFSIDYTYYILNELSKIDVDKLIDVYNDEFMNINSKSGIIGLLKMTNNELGDFEENRTINMNTLTSLGVNDAEVIADEYPEFVNLDNPLFLNVLNLFDKDDLVEKLNDDIKIVPKIIEFWKNN